MGWMYMVVCITDFVVFPVLWSLAQTMINQNITQWNPLTIQGAGLFHIAMGAVLGLATWGRTQEKLNGANNGRMLVPTAAVPSPVLRPSYLDSSQVVTGYGGRRAPPPIESFPEK